MNENGKIHSRAANVKLTAKSISRHGCSLSDRIDVSLSVKSLSFRDRFSRNRARGSVDRTRNAEDDLRHRSPPRDEARRRTREGARRRTLATRISAIPSTRVSAYEQMQREASAHARVKRGASVVPCAVPETAKNFASLRIWQHRRHGHCGEPCTT